MRWRRRLVLAVLAVLALGFAVEHTGSFRSSQWCSRCDAARHREGLWLLLPDTFIPVRTRLVRYDEPTPARLYARLGWHEDHEHRWHSQGSSARSWGVITRVTRLGCGGGRPPYYLVDVEDDLMRACAWDEDGVRALVDNGLLASVGDDEIRAATTSPEAWAAFVATRHEP